MTSKVFKTILIVNKFLLLQWVILCGVVSVEAVINVSEPIDSSPPQVIHQFSISQIKPAGSLHPTNPIKNFGVPSMVAADVCSLSAYTHSLCQQHAFSILYFRLYNSRLHDSTVDKWETVYARGKLLDLLCLSKN